MPSNTRKQAKFMAAVAHGWKPTGKGVKAPPLKIAREFNRADKEAGMRHPKMKKATGGPIRGGHMVRSTPHQSSYENKPHPHMRGGGMMARMAGPLQQAMRSRQNQAGKMQMPGAQPSRMPPSGPSGPGAGSRSRFGPPGRTGALGAANRSPGAPRSRMGRFGGPGGGRIAGKVPNGLLRTADTAVNQAGTQLGRLRQGMPGTQGRQNPRGGMKRTRAIGQPGGAPWWERGVRGPGFNEGGGVEALEDLADDFRVDLEEHSRGLPRLFKAKGGLVARAAKLLSDYMGQDLSGMKVDAVPDPEMPGVIAVRVEGKGDFIVNENAENILDEGIEEVEFESWPPGKAKNPNPFYASGGRVRQAYDALNEIDGYAKGGKVRSTIDRILKQMDRSGVLEDRREYDVEDLKLAYDLDDKDAQELYRKVQAIFAPTKKAKGGAIRKAARYIAHYDDLEGYRRSRSGNTKEEAREKLQALIHQENGGSGKELLEEFGVTYSKK